MFLVLYIVRQSIEFKLLIQDLQQHQVRSSIEAHKVILSNLLNKVILLNILVRILVQTIKVHKDLHILLVNRINMGHQTLLNNKDIVQQHSQTMVLQLQ